MFALVVVRFLVWFMALVFIVLMQLRFCFLVRVFE